MKKKLLLKELIADFHTTSLPTTVKREISLPLDSGKIITLTGVRRCGKTFLLYEAIKTLLTHGLAMRNILYLNFEDERLILATEELDLILQVYRELYPGIYLTDCYFFFDEIQNIPDWERFIRRVYDSVTRHIFITGSNARFLSTEIATSLRGRSVTYEVFPLAFREYLWFLGVDDKGQDAQSKAVIAHHFEHYLVVGGFPELTGTSDPLFRKKVLQEYFNVMLYRDLVEHYHISNLPVLRYFVRRVMEGITSVISPNKIFNELKSQGYRIGKNTLYDYLDAVEAIYLFQILKKFNPSVVKQELGEKKAYVIDTGLLNAVTFAYSKDDRKLLENAVYLHLRRLGRPLFFLKDRRECDFIVADQNGVLTPTQVAYSIGDRDTAKREINGAIEACKRLKTNHAQIITLSEQASLHEDGVSIEVWPAAQFFLANQWH